MRYGLISDNPDEEWVRSSPRGPRALFDTSLPLLQAKAIMVAARLSIFDGLRAGPRTAASLAAERRLDATTLELLLRVLACAGYVTWDSGRYALTALARDSLVAASPACLKSHVALCELLWSQFGVMGNVVGSGVGFDLHASLTGSDAWTTYQMAMLELARRNAPFVAGLVHVKPGARRLLDVGGSHGLYGAQICRAHPPMRSEVLDLADAVDAARPLAAAEGHGDIVTHRVGDARIDELGTDYDVVFLGNLLHHFTPTEVQMVMAKVRRALTRDGTVAIWEIQAPGFDAPPDLVGDGFALFFRMTSTTPGYTACAYGDWLRSAGFADVRVDLHPLVPFQALITGVNRSSADGQ